VGGFFKRCEPSGLCMHVLFVLWWQVNHHQDYEDGPKEDPKNQYHYRPFYQQPSSQVHVKPFANLALLFVQLKLVSFFFQQMHLKICVNKALVNFHTQMNTNEKIIIINP
jgi:hypothetical protein